jgi:hypothetical protein
MVVAHCDDGINLYINTGIDIVPVFDKTIVTKIIFNCEHINGRFVSCTQLTSVELTGVTVIGETAFDGCSMLHSVYIPKTVTSIGKNAFNGCPLTYTYNGKFNLFECPENAPSTTLSIGDYAFFNTTLVQIEFPLNTINIGSNAFDMCKSLMFVSFQEPSQLTHIRSSAFKESTLTEVTLPDSIEVIERNAFFNCGCLTKVVFGAKLKTIGEGAFRSCLNLNMVEFDDINNAELKSIGNGAFYKCPFSSFHIPKSVETIDDYAFYGCGKLTNSTSLFHCPSSVKSIGDSAFSYTAFEEMYVPASVETIGNNSFEHCSKLWFVEFFNVKTIGTNAFRYCPLRELQLPQSLELIGDGAFDGSDTIESVTFLPNSKLKTIGKYAFRKCSIAQISIPETIETIDEYAFTECRKLVNVSFRINPIKLTTIGTGAFSQCCALQTFDISSASAVIGEAAFINCTSLRLLNLGKATAIHTFAFRGCASLAAVIIPNTTKTIGNSAFMNCVSLRNVAFETGSVLTTIGSSAFAVCNALTSISIPVSVDTMSADTFELCNLLKNVTASPSILSCFNGLTSITVLGNNGVSINADPIVAMGSVTFSNGIKHIAFGGGSFDSIRLPATCKTFVTDPPVLTNTFIIPYDFEVDPAAFAEPPGCLRFVKNSFVAIYERNCSFNGAVYIEDGTDAIYFEDAAYQFSSLRIPESCKMVRLGKGTSFPNLKSASYEVISQIMAKSTNY